MKRIIHNLLILNRENGCSQVIFTIAVLIVNKKITSYPNQKINLLTMTTIMKMICN